MRTPNTTMLKLLFTLLLLLLVPWPVHCQDYCQQFPYTGGPIEAQGGPERSFTITAPANWTLTAFNVSLFTGHSDYFDALSL